MRGASSGEEEGVKALEQRLSDSRKNRSASLERLLIAAGEAVKAGETAGFKTQPPNGAEVEEEDEDELEESGIHKLDHDARMELRKRALEASGRDREAALGRIKRTAAAIQTYRGPAWFDPEKIGLAASQPPGPEDGDPA
jgi:hypothetical protein